MSRIQDVKLEIVRPGPPHNQLLSPLTSYMALCGDGSPITFSIKFEHRQLLNRLEHLRYIVPKSTGGYETVSDSTRTGELNELSADMARVLSGITSLNAELNRSRTSTEAAGDRSFVHLRLILSGSELSLLPFELAVAPQSFPGEGLQFCLQDSLPIVVTREVRRSGPQPIHWNQYKKPRVLFISAAPGNLSVPTKPHVYALRAALEPWIEWPRKTADPADKDKTPELEDRATIERQRLDNVRDRLKILTDASLDDIYEACAGTQFSHIHILAHGDYFKAAGEDRFGVALCKKGKPNEKVVVTGVQLAEALRAVSADGNSQAEPVMVTLATCDSGQTGSVLVPGGSIAHDLHAAGIPWVFASQFPLKKRSSVWMTEFMYPLLLRGDDPRRVLYELRRYMHMKSNNDHDWASLVCYASVPAGFEDQIASFFESQTRLAIDVQMGKTDDVVEGRAPLEKPMDPDEDSEKTAIDNALKEAIRLLDAWEKRLPTGMTMEERGQRTSCYGIRGSVLKRFGLVYGLRKDHTRAADVLKRAYAAYRKGMREWATDGEGYHWTATQYLCLSAVLDQNDDPDTLTLSRRFAKQTLTNATDRTKAWAHGTLAELELLSLWHGPKGEDVESKVEEHCRKIIDLTSANSFPTESTRRHFERYINRWYQEGCRNGKWDEMVSIAKRAVSALTCSPAK